MSCKLPSDVPIDYFEPEFFNSLSVLERASYMDNGVALPCADLCKKWEDIEKWRALKAEEFMAQYGQKKLELYNLPTPEEVSQFQ